MTTLATIIPSILNSLVNGRVYQDATPDQVLRGDDGTILPFVLWTRQGGNDAEYLDQTMGVRRHARIQVFSMAPDSIGAEELEEQVLQALLASTYTVGVYGSPVGTFDAPRKLRGRRRFFSIQWTQ